MKVSSSLIIVLSRLSSPRIGTMTRTKRIAQVNVSPATWFDRVRAALRRWLKPNRLPANLQPRRRGQRPRSFRPSLEIFEDRASPTNLGVEGLLAQAAMVATANIALAGRAPEVADAATKDNAAGASRDRDNSFDEFLHQSTVAASQAEVNLHAFRMDGSNAAGETALAGRHAKTSDTAFDAQTDPLSDPALAGERIGRHDAGGHGKNESNANAPNGGGANALAGIGSAVGGVSTPAVQSGGGGASGGGGGGSNNQLNQLGLQGAFSGPTGAVASNATAPAAANTANVAHAPVTATAAQPQAHSSVRLTPQSPLTIKSQGATTHSIQTTSYPPQVLFAASSYNVNEIGGSVTIGVSMFNTEPTSTITVH